MRHALRAEWCKLRTLRSTRRLLLAVLTTTVALGAVADRAVSCPDAGCRLDPARTSLTGVYLSQVFVVVLAVSTITGEYGTGMIRLTFAAVPSRVTVLAAKALTTSGLVAAAAVPAVLACVLTGRFVLPGRGLTAAHGRPPLSLGDGPVLRATAGTVLYLALIALLSLGVAAALRDTATAVGAVLGLLYIVPIITATTHLADHIRRLAPMPAGLAIQATTDLRDLPISPWPGLGVLAAWAAGALLAGGLLLHRRDA